MPYCSNCGTKLDDNASFCSECGTPVKKQEQNNQSLQNTQQNNQNVQPAQQSQSWQQETNNQYNQYNESPFQLPEEQSDPTDGQNGCLFGFLSFLFPIVGLILFILWKDQKPKTAKTCGITALVSFILNLVLYGLLTAIGNAFMGSF